MRLTPYRPLFALATLLAFGCADASLYGRNGFSGNPRTQNGATCAACHAPGPATPTVTISGPQVLDANTVADFTVTLTGGPGATAGLGVSASGAAGTFQASGKDVHVIGGEISHRQPKAFSGGAVSFSFRWRAPAWNGPVTLYAAGNSSNGQLNLLGDGIGTGQLAITVRNGSGSPPEPPAPPPSEAVLEPFATGLSQPVAITHAGDARLFVAEQPGRIRIIDQATLRPVPFLDIRERVDDSGNEQGLLGLAFHPRYAKNGYFYVNYTWDPPGSGLDRTRISRFKVGADPNVADPASELVLMEFEQPYSNHNGGDIQFGPDGYLYIASGDGGSGGDPQNNAQNPNRLLGKLLRIDVDGGGAPDCSLVGGNRYGIPAGNAYGDGAGGAGCDEIFALGLRNPWRIAFDALLGDLWIADVGQNAYEEINFIQAGTSGGLNFGWRCYEGDQPYNTSGCSGSYFEPLVTTSHSAGSCSITGGRVYRGSSHPSLAGRYFFTDYCNTAVRTITFADGQPRVETPIPAGAISQPVAFGEDANGELYLASLTGTLYRIVGTGDTGESRISTLTSQQCLHAPSTAAGTALLTWPCVGGGGQRWVLRGDGSLYNPASDRCATAAGTTHGAALQLQACSGTTSQRFAATPAGELRVGGLCTDHSRTMRRRVQASTCAGIDSQAWVVSPAD
ncbi:PQQ-dependent sugar dehydrogenase [Luteimonas sp. MC1895]|uniref:PQQ-dependent sugar dehydrogenase n=1 Tax=Luteimonas sp. MC1895 TaxID=2819513 RepID=UPI0018F0B472|nr:PQQ-dependent sugar dehydrogenase [Luteimonas sp. MC1895]MBJ6979051.1 PQQ-dependent sugar dehydrogenase [Luteimonas sp. MC1895]